MLLTLVDNDASKESYLLIVIEHDNFVRMCQSDPITLETRANGGVIPVPKYPEGLRILIAYEEDSVTLWKLGQGGKFQDMVDYVTRGWNFRRGEDGTENAFSLRTGSRFPFPQAAPDEKL